METFFFFLDSVGFCTENAHQERMPTSLLFECDSTNSLPGFAPGLFLDPIQSDEFTESTFE